MSLWIALFLEILALIAIVPVVILGFYYGYSMLYLGIKLSSRRRRDAPLTWHDGWGFMRFGQIAYPELLDAEGQILRRKMIHAIKRFCIAAAGGVIVTTFHELAQVIAPL